LGTKNKYRQPFFGSWSLDLICPGLDLLFSGLDLIISKFDLIFSGLDLIFSSIDLIFSGLDLPCPDSQYSYFGNPTSLKP